MTWSLYRWVWRLESPLHIGLPPAGALNRTRLYVPARNLWGALTAELVRRQSEHFPDYAAWGDKLKRDVRFSYLFPAEQVNDAWEAWLPRYEEGEGLGWKHEGEGTAQADRHFRMRLLITRPGTAIEHESDTAAEGTLREFELISPYWREDAFKPVAMVGYLFCKEDSLLKEIQQIEELFIGGDTRYGLGRITRVAFEQVSDFFCDAKVNVQGNGSPRITVSQVLAHTRPHTNLTLRGAMESVGGWDMPQGRMNAPKLVWAPGSIEPNAQQREFEIQEDGLWQTIG